MGIVQCKKNLLSRFGRGAMLILLGIVIGVVGILMLILLRQPDMNEIKEANLQYTVNYIKSEQRHLGIDCHSLRKNIQNFLIDEIHPVLRTYNLRNGQAVHFSQDARKRMEKIRDDYFICGRLYQAAQSVQWDEFMDVDFAVRIDTEIILLNTLIRFGEFGKTCDEICLDGNFNSIETAALKIENQLTKHESKESKGPSSN